MNSLDVVNGKLNHFCGGGRGVSGVSYEQEAVGQGAGCQRKHTVVMISLDSSAHPLQLEYGCLSKSPVV